VVFGGGVGAAQVVAKLIGGRKKRITRAAARSERSDKRVESVAISCLLFF
jgi:hypothetical protein